MESKEVLENYLTSYFELYVKEEYKSSFKKSLQILSKLDSKKFNENDLMYHFIYSLIVDLDKRIVDIEEKLSDLKDCDF